jgi:hypothetical protein
MNLPARVVDICWALYRLHRDLAEGDDDQRRILTRMIAEQCHFELGSRWGVKSRDAFTPQSKDSIAFLDVQPAFFNWDWQNGTTREPQVVAGQPGERITDQLWLAVSPVNHLSGAPIPPQPTPPSPTYPPYPGDQYGTQIGNVLFADYARAGQAPNSGMGVWFWRTAWDAATGLTVDESIAKHRAEWCAVLGIPVLLSGSGVIQEPAET